MTFKPTGHKPKPFQRPGIELAGSGKPRAWKWLRARYCAIGDTWANHGEIKAFRSRHDGRLDILAGSASLYEPVGLDEKIHVFTVETDE